MGRLSARDIERQEREAEAQAWERELGITVVDTGEFPARDAVIRNGEEVFSSKHGANICRIWVRGFVAGRISGLEDVVNRQKGSHGTAS